LKKNCKSQNWQKIKISTSDTCYKPFWGCKKLERSALANFSTLAYSYNKSISLPKNSTLSLHILIEAKSAKIFGSVKPGKPN
jgi:hypothetical protein